MLGSGSTGGGSVSPRKVRGSPGNRAPADDANSSDPVDALELYFRAFEKAGVLKIREK